MKISLALFIYLFHGITCMETGFNLTEYLDNRAKIVGEELIRYARNPENLYTVKLDEVNNLQLNGNYSSGEILFFFNKPYLALDKKIFEIGENYTTIPIFTWSKNIFLWKATEFKNMSFLMFATERNLRIFGFRNKTGFFKIQNIVLSNITDARFFKIQNNLFLVVSSSKSYDLTSVIIYKFIGSYFDETANFLTSGATKLHTFGNNGSEVIMVLQRLGVATLYEFKSDKIRKLHKIDLNNSTEVLSYIDDGKQHVLFLSDHFVYQYQWTGSDLLFSELFKVKLPANATKSVLYVNSKPYLVIVNTSTFLVFSLSNFLEIHNSGIIISTNWLKVLNVKSTEGVVMMVGKTENAVEVKTASISIQATLQKENIVEEEKLLNCFLNLEKTVYLLRNKITNVENTTRKSKERTNDDFPMKKWQDLKTKYSTVKSVVEGKKKRILIVNKPATVVIPKGAKKLIAADLRFFNLNSQKWQPETWLSYSQTQTISTPVAIRSLETNNFQTKYNEPLLNDVMLSGYNQIFSGFMKAKNVEVHRLETKSLNNISMSNFYYKSQPVKIKGVKTFPDVQISEVKVDRINGMDATNRVSVLSSFPDNFTVENLWVDNINGVNFTNLKEMAFRIGQVDTINGSLIFQHLEAKEASFETLSGMSSVLTSSTDQTIHSFIDTNLIFATNVTTNRINDIDFKNSAMTFDGIVNGPVSLNNLNVKNNLELKGDIDKQFLLFNNTHIVGTNESDFLQRYNGNVTIKGNLILNDLNLVQGAKIFVNGTEFDPKIDQFWTKTTPQKIAHFEAKNGMSTPHLFTNLINGINVSDFMLNSTDQMKSGRFYFESVMVDGDILLDPEQQHSPNFEKIQDEGVKTEGVFKIKGRKTYSNILKVDDLEVGHLEGGNDQITSRNIDRNMIIKGNLNLQRISVKNINNVNIKNLTENAVYIDKAQVIHKLNFLNLTAENVFVLSTVNGKNISEVALNLKKIQESKKIDSVYVNDNVTIENIKNLTTINNNKVDELLKTSHKLYKNQTIFVPTKFTGTVKVKDLHILTVNDVNLQQLSRRILYKSWNQPISELYNFTKLETENLITQKINDINVRDLIDVSAEESQKIFTSHNLTMTEHVTIQNLDGDFGCSLHESLKNLHNPLSQLWDSVVITGNATFWDKESPTSRIFAEIVTQETSGAVIKAKVHFAEHISVNNITALKKINGIEIMEIIQDAIVNKPDFTQVVTGKKTFIQIEAEDMLALKNTNVSRINEIEIAEIDAKIVSKNSVPNVPIRGHKTFFGGLQTKQLQTNIISGVQVENLVNSEDEAPIPSVMFESVNVIDNFNVTLINKMLVEQFLNERLLKKGTDQRVTGNFFFQYITFKGDATTTHINDIDVENIVFDIGTQVISSPKKFRDLKVRGNITVHLINGFDLSKLYEQAVFQNEETSFKGAVHLLKPTLMEGNIQTRYINKVPVDYMFDTSAQYSVQIEAQQIHEITKILGGFIKKYIDTTKALPSKILYLEKFKELQINLPNTVSAHVVETKDNILLHVETEENGEKCGLDPLCTCPMQQTMQISSKDSVIPFVNKEMQRVYSYYSDDLIINFITYSGSSRSECRTNTTKVINERSTLTWSVPPQMNITGGFFLHRTLFTGFISSVEFFTIYGRTYIVVGTYYDAVLDTHNVNILLLKINQDKTEVEEIQKIPSNGMKIISSFPTAQGFILILSNQLGKSNGTNTRIMRFDQAKEKFGTLREVQSFGTLHAEGVVLGRDSLIVLANKQSHLIILKYHPGFDNYYLYQSFQLTSPISSILAFYGEGFGISDAYLTVVTENHQYFIYSFWFIEGWRLEFSGQLDDTTILVPLKLNGKPYLFAPARKTSSLLALVKHDSD